MFSFIDAYYIFEIKIIVNFIDYIKPKIKIEKYNFHRDAFEKAEMIKELREYYNKLLEKW